MLSFLLFFLIFGSITLSWSVGVSYGITRIFPILEKVRTLFIGFAIISTIAFIGGILGSNIVPSPIFPVLYFYGSVWIGFITIAGFLSIFTYLVTRIFRISLAGKAPFILFMIILFGINIMGIYFSFCPKVTNYIIEIPGEHGWHGKRIIMIADTHYGNIYDASDAEKLVSTINTLSGDILIIPGDFFDGPKIDFQEVAKEFESVHTKYGTLFANGNHEEYRNTDEMIDAISRANIQILNNKKITIDGLVFAGVTYQSTEESNGLIHTLDALVLEKGVPTILLKHKPTLHDIVGDYPVNLVVSGHTHYGQMWPFSLVTRAIYGKYAYGYYSSGSLQSITTSGAGTWGPPQRVGSRSEIVTIDIK